MIMMNGTRVDDDPTGLGAPPTSELALLVTINLVCLMIAAVRQKYGFAQWLPSQGLTMILGLAMGILVRAADSGNDFVISYSSHFSGLFFEFFLPPIIFSASYSLRRQDFFRNLGSILTLAVFGTVLSSLAIGLGLRRLVVSGLVDLPLGAVDCMVVGAMLSAVDPVATISVLRSAKIERQLHALLLGESVLNDAVAIVVYNMLLAHRAHAASGDDPELFTMRTALTLFAGFSSICVGSLLLGLAIGLTSALAIRYCTDRSPAMEQSIMLLFAYAAYLLARMSGLSPVMCLFITGVTMAHYTFYSLSVESQISTSFTFRSIAQVTETFVFVFLGFAATCMPTNYWNASLTLALPLLCVVSRCLQVAVLCFFINVAKTVRGWLRGKKDKELISVRSQVMLAWAGLRGAVAFALSLHAPVLGHRGFLVTTTMVIVLLTFFIQGSSSRWVAASLGLIQKSDGYDLLISGSADEHLDDDDDDADPVYMSPRRKKSRADALKQAESAAASPATIERREKEKTAWRSFDDRFMKPIFGGKGSNDVLHPGERIPLFSRFLPRFHSFLSGSTAVRSVAAENYGVGSATVDDDAFVSNNYGTTTVSM